MNKQLTIDNMSPITAASVPSPSSPLENCDIAGTKTLEMLKDATFSSISNFTKEDHAISYNLNELHSDKNSSSQINFHRNFTNDFNQDIRFPVETTKITNAIAQNNTVQNKSQDIINVSLPAPMCTRFQNISPNCSTYNLSFNEKNEFSTVCQTNIKSVETCIDQATLMLSQSKVEDGIFNQNSQEAPQNIKLISKLIKNPNIFVKVFEDSNFLEKFVSDLDLIEKLVSNPDLAQILEKYASFSTPEKLKNTLDKNLDFNTNNRDEQIKEDRISTNYKKNLSNQDQNNVQNPILTHLMNNQNVEEQSKDACKVSEKCLRLDITDNILKDVQK